MTRNNLETLDVAFPLGVFTTVTGVSGSGKSSLVSQALVELVAAGLGHDITRDADEGEELERSAPLPLEGSITAGLESIKRLVTRRSKTNRTHAAIESRDLHRALRSRAHACSPQPGVRARAITTPGASRSTSAKGAAKPARARAS